MPTVSVIMNIYNGADYVADAIRSVLAQTYEDWEIIACDDCSADDSARIVQSFDDARIKYVKVADKSPSLLAARLQAIDHAQGQWLAFLDQDDLWLPDKLALQMGQVKPEVGLVYTRSVLFREHRLLRDYDHKHEFKMLPQGKIFKDLLWMSCFICMSSVMVRKSIVDALEIPDDINVSPDYYLYLQTSLDHKVAAVEKTVSLYRLHGANMSRNVYQNIQREVIFMMDHFSDHALEDSRDRRKRIHHSLLAFEKMKKPRLFVSGVMDLLTRGSVFYFLSRPIARVKRGLWRLIFNPRWEKDKQALSTLLNREVK